MGIAEMRGLKMTYPIWIGANKDGKMIIGAKEMTRQGEKYHNVEDAEQVYGIQLPHRVVAKTPGGHRIMTPTEARKNGYQITDAGHVSPFNRAIRSVA